MEKNNDFTVWLNERYNMTKEEFESHMMWEEKLLGIVNLPVKQLRYEEESCAHRLSNVDYDRLFVGAHLYYDTAPFDRLGANFDEVEVTHLYGGVMFFRILEGKRAGDEEFLSRHCFGFMCQLYPKVIMKPSCIEMTCDCPKTIFKNW